ncbi:MAG: sigma-70 family RNA polymerase sigma factor [Planctomycetota bacterium]
MPSNSTHVTLLRALASSESEVVWAEFVDRYGELIRGFARRQGLSTEDREDVLQDVLLALTQAIKQFEYDPAKGRFRSYLKTITLRAIFARHRKAKRSEPRGQELIADADSPVDDQLDADWEDEWRLHHLRRGMLHAQHVASDSDLAAFRAFAIEARPSEEVAGALRISVDQVYQAKSRVLRLIRESVREQIEAEG